MQKVVDFLERYCQWVAVGIGAVFFLFALYQYLPVVSTPVKTTLGNEVVTPGEIDAKIATNVAEPLETAMNDSNSIAIKVPNYIQQVTDRATNVPKVAALSSSMTTVRKVELPDLPWDSSNSLQNPVASAVVLPIAPAPVLDPEPTSGFAQVTPMAAEPGAAPAAAAENAVDVTWVRVPFRVSVTQIDREMRQANVPAALVKTNFVRVELLRQRQLPDGNWGPEEVIKPIATADILPVPTGNSVPALLQYNEWAAQHQQDIVQPRFFQFVAGDHPLMQPAAQLADGGAAAGAPPFDPETHVGSLDSLTPEQRKQVMEVRRRRAKEEADARRAAGAGRGQQGGGDRGQGGMPGGGMPGGGRGAPPFVAPDSSASPLPAPKLFGGGGGSGGGGGPGGGGPRPGGGTPPPMPPAGGPPAGGFPPNEGYGPGMDGMPPPTGSEIGLPPVPSGQFVPVAGTPDIVGHAYDMTAKPGAVYRYRIRYSIMNPLFNAAVAGVGPQVAGVYEIVGQDPSKWTTAVTVKSNNHVYLQAVPTPGGSVVRFTIFRWQNGKCNRANQAFAPGDGIGKVDGSIDYTSNFTLVDVRKDSTSDRAYALIMSDDGMVQRRDFDADSATKEYKDLVTAVEGPPVQPAGQGMPGGFPGGAYPGGGYPGMGGYPGAGGPRP